MSSRLALLVAASSLLRPALTMLTYLPSGHPLVAEGSAQPGVSLSSLGLGMPGSPEFEAQYRKLLGVEEAPPPPPPPLAVEESDDTGAAAFLPLNATDLSMFEGVNAAVYMPSSGNCNLSRWVTATMRWRHEPR